MPHISGGGFRGGGFHSGGFRGGGSHGYRGGTHSYGHAAPIRKTPYLGARKHRYFRHGHWHYFYKADTEKMPLILRIFVGLCFMPVLIMSVFGIVFPIVKQYKRFHLRNTEILIKDEAHLLQNDSALRKSMSDFYKKTRIVPAVVTIHNEEWRDDYAALEHYAYDRYLNEFDDEMHWLIVYSEPVTPAPELTDPYSNWCWAGIQGDDTDPILTQYAAMEFNSDFHGRLEKRDGLAVDDLAAAFDLAAEKASEPDDFPIPPLSASMIPAFLFFLFTFYLCTGLYEFKYRHAEPDPDSPGIIEHDAPDPYGELRVYEKDFCMYCGAEYYIGVRTCPKCGATLPFLSPDDIIK